MQLSYAAAREIVAKVKAAVAAGKDPVPDLRDLYLVRDPDDSHRLGAFGPTIPSEYLVVRSRHG
jgi:hypothetical protein